MTEHAELRSMIMRQGSNLILGKHEYELVCFYTSMRSSCSYGDQTIIEIYCTCFVLKVGKFGTGSLMKPIASRLAIVSATFASLAALTP